MKFIKFIVGLIVSVLLVITGLILTNFFEHGFFLSAFSIAVPVIGIYQFIFGQKQIAWGLLTATIPLAILAIAFVTASSLH